jgi:hypothetical protein
VPPVEEAARDHGDGSDGVQKDEADRGPVAEAGDAGLHALDAGGAVKQPEQRQAAGDDQQDDQHEKPSSLRHAVWEGLKDKAKGMVGDPVYLNRSQPDFYPVLPCYWIFSA